jgi:phage recombination protein Bet
MQAMTLAEPAAPAVTPEQHDLIRRTVAKDATDDELRLYLYDCSRQGVHPLDKLIHFTKRGGKYTPITSIDLMRMRAADTNEYAGNERYTFTGTPGTSSFIAVSTVWRLVNGTRCNFTREARWSEYCPPPGQDHMWRKMPHIMLGKCAEAQALRAGFPRQLHGLYAAEEMEQAERPAKITEGPVPVVVDAWAGPQSAMGQYDTVAAPPPALAEAPDNLSADDNLPEGIVRITRIDSTPTKNVNVTKYFITTSTGESLTTINSFLATVAQDACEKRTPVKLETKTTKWGTDLIKITAADAPAPHPEPPPDADDIPF